MKEKNTIYTDFADEIITKETKNKAYKYTEKQNDYIKMHHISVLEDENELRKEKGEYITIECEDMGNHIARTHMAEAICESMMHMCEARNFNFQKILVIGLGNREIISDALGPYVASKLLVTAHLYENEDKAYLKGTRNVAVLSPGVMGQTGMESFSIVKSVTQMYQPDLIIAIDALATRNLNRINRVIQLNDTGIQPGSGVGNYRHALNEASLHVPVIAIGVATVSSVGAIVSDVLQDEKDAKNILKRLSKVKRMDMIVTPKSMDDALQYLTDMLSDGINHFLHPDFDNL